MSLLSRWVSRFTKLGNLCKPSTLGQLPERGQVELRGS